MWRDGRILGATGLGVRLDFETMPQGGVEAIGFLRGGKVIGVLWFAPFSVYAELGAGRDRELIEDCGDAEDVVEIVLERLERRWSAEAAQNSR